jgi:hypothetical protein
MAPRLRPSLMRNWDNQHQYSLNMINEYDQLIADEELGFSVCSLTELQ